MKREFKVGDWVCWDDEKGRQRNGRVLSIEAYEYAVVIDDEGPRSGHVVWISEERLSGI